MYTRLGGPAKSAHGRPRRTWKREEEKMKRFMRQLVVITAIFAFLAIPVISQAVTCTITGKVQKTYSYCGGSLDYAYYYIEPLSTGVASYHGYVYVAGDDDRMSDMLSAAFAANDTVQVSSTNLSVCPTSGSYRYYGIVSWGYVYTTW
jgi:hypothetical protein